MSVGNTNITGSSTCKYVLATIVDYDTARILIQYNGRRRIIHMFSTACERGGTMIVCILERGGYIPYAVYRVHEYAKAIDDLVAVKKSL